MCSIYSDLILFVPRKCEEIYLGISVRFSFKRVEIKNTNSTGFNICILKIFIISNLFSDNSCVDNSIIEQKNLFSTRNPSTNSFGKAFSKILGFKFQVKIVNKCNLSLSAFSDSKLRFTILSEN
ncbi:hypothetical protein BpHYR1_034317 [Brachionus plicatilis]|uniref:Uncharacterized protein n=1 Tax=Brachionus plicatilis TaxID=10195 RepID=A0A3M7RUX2_BRAPC|nr:hypothetical protein BpHYR1_034317 [Brachionus plicatilis]